MPIQPCSVPFSIFVPQKLLSIPASVGVSVALYFSVPLLGRLLRAPCPARQRWSQRLLFLNNGLYGLASAVSAVFVILLLARDYFETPNEEPREAKRWCSLPSYGASTTPLWSTLNGLYLASKLWEFLDIILLLARTGSSKAILPHFRIHHATTFFLTLLSFCHAPSLILPYVVLCNLIHHAVMYPYFALAGLTRLKTLHGVLSKMLEVTGTFQLLLGVFGGIATISSRFAERQRANIGHEARCNVSNEAMGAEVVLFLFMLLFLYNWAHELVERWETKKVL